MAHDTERDSSFFFPTETNARAFAAEGESHALRVDVIEPDSSEEQWSAWACYPGLPVRERDAEVKALAEKHNGEWFGSGFYFGTEASAD